MEEALYGLYKIIFVDHITILEEVTEAVEVLSYRIKVGAVRK